MADQLTPAAVHRARREPPVPARALLVLGLLYLFLVGVGLLSEGIGSLGADLQERLFSHVASPLAGLSVGVLATVLVQSSSVTTSTIVGLVAAGVLGVEDAVPMVMGANIGTSVTNTLASVGSIRRPLEFKRAVAAATVHDAFNLMAVAFLLPIELATGILARSARAISGLFAGGGTADIDSPIKAMVEAPIAVLVDTAERIGWHGTVLAIVLVALGLTAIFVGLALITSNMKALVAGSMEARLNRVLGGGSGLVAMGVGLLVTVAVQSSSITTSVLVPIAAAGVITLPKLYPITLGANIGTTITALLASLAADTPEALTIALVHTLFNLVGILVLYGIPLLRPLPIRAAEAVAERMTQNRSLLTVYIGGVFVALPLVGVLIFG